MNSAIRGIAVTLLGAFEIACFVLTIATWNQPGAIFGWNVAADGVTLINVEPGGPAARAGIVSGDKFDYASMPVIGRINLVLTEAVYPGTSLTFAVEHGGTRRTVTLRPTELPLILGASYVGEEVGGLALGLIGLALVTLRPSRITWGCALIAPPLLLPAGITFWEQQTAAGAAFAYQIAVAILYALQTFGLFTFASRFPSDEPRGMALWIDRCAIPFALLSTAVYVYVDYAIFVASSPPHYWALAAQDYGISILEAVAVLLALFSTYESAPRAGRSRILPVIASFLLVVAAETANQFVNQMSSSPSVYVAAAACTAVALTLFAATIAYGVVKHRVIDVSFIISRTIVYTILTVFVVAIFSLIEYVFGKVLEHQGVATFLEIAAAVGLGLSLNVLHGKLDELIDRTIFRKRHLAEKRLELASKTLPHAVSTALVEELLVAEPVDALELASAAVFRRNGTAFRRDNSAGWAAADAAELDDDDHLVARLRAELEPISIAELRWPREDLPRGLSQPLYAVPIASGHNLTAIALYGGHAGGEDLDPDERRSLRGLAAGAALAYDHLAAEELQRTIEELRGENEALRQSQELLVERVLKHLQ